MSRTSTGAAPHSTAPTAVAREGLSQDSDLSTRSLIKQGLAALAISALGLGVAGSVALTAAAQSEEVSQATVAGQGNPDTSHAVPAAQEQQQDGQLPAVKANSTDANDQNGEGLDVFARKADGASRNAVRAELDRAVAEKYASDRGATLTESGEKATDASSLAIQDNRSSKLQNNQEARKREQARLAEEKRKAEEALKQSKAAAAAPAAPGAAPAPDPEPATNAGAPAEGGAAATGSGGATTPMDKKNYSLGARWGAVGSWSRYHTGQDMSAPIGTPVRAAADGVAKSPNGGGWAGNHAIIDHGDGSTLYAHMQRSLVRPGQQVKGGQVIGYVGMTGRSFGPHLHFEYYPAGASTSNPYTTSDPYRWMLSRGVRL